MSLQNTLFSAALPKVRKDLRDYQEECLDALFDYFTEKDGEPICVVPVGGGKSLLMGEFMYRANQYFNPTRFMVLSHVAILLQQNAEELLNQWPTAPISFYSDSLNSKDLSGDIIFAGIQSIYKKAYDLRHTVDLILIDECHTLGPDDSAMYRQFLNDMRAINPHIRIIGFTGTPFRAGYGYLHKGKNALFTDIAYEIPILELINRGYLCRIVTPEGGIKTKMDVTGVKTSRGDYVAAQLSKAVDNDPITRACVDEIIEHGADRKKWLVFGVDIKHAEHIHKEISLRGVSCEVIHSKLDDHANNGALDRFKHGNLRCLVNVAKLTVGYNNPAIDLMVFMRPTRSPVLYIQMAGRGMRTAPGKSDCLLLDFGGVVETLGPIDQIRIKEKEDGEGEASMKYCEKCGACCPAGCATCPECGHPFPENGLNLNTKASNAAVLSSLSRPQLKKVSKVAYFRHKKEGKPDTLRVDYLCGFDTYREWLCFSHTGFPREKACNWWKDRANSVSSPIPPQSTDEALTRSEQLKIPSHIYVKKVGQYFEITNYEWNPDLVIEDVTW